MVHVEINVIVGKLPYIYIFFYKIDDNFTDIIFVKLLIIYTIY